MALEIFEKNKWFNLLTADKFFSQCGDHKNKYKHKLMEDFLIWLSDFLHQPTEQTTWIIPTVHNRLLWLFYSTRYLLNSIRRPPVSRVSHLPKLHQPPQSEDLHFSSLIKEKKTRSWWNIQTKNLLCRSNLRQFTKYSFYWLSLIQLILLSRGFLRFWLTLLVNQGQGSHFVGREIIENYNL